ncbi:hypothetical protein MCOR31_006751 [Pyricularia oryzae]|nr:hypothetical protein MCOR19_011301 [Pyricularia oryzae]KAI6277561.1 hypothetical protein MCOR26_005083 [Pyricularia oryzae]KAI6307794.1 hypothetical protein MCOR30_011636 [Pyricularia oryzae]KAI6336550.1 hypothetical protein MCOR28_009038 [Pyricularia oryzae]KAI6365925.1 hypothetical protein MCOR31_006751 [Pyricularia oryzae]
MLRYHVFGHKCIQSPNATWGIGYHLRRVHHHWGQLIRRYGWTSFAFPKATPFEDRQNSCPRTDANRVREGELEGKNNGESACGPGQGWGQLYELHQNDKLLLVADAYYEKEGIVLRVVKWAEQTIEPRFVYRAS